jgi:Tfp pilus assembly protein PilF
VSAAPQIHTATGGDPKQLLAEADRRLAAGDAVGALMLFRAAAAGPYGAYAELRQGQLLQQLGRWTEARAALLRADALKPGDGPILFSLANLARERGDMASAESGYRAALAASPRSVEPAVNLGALLRQSGRPDDAAAIMEEALHRCGDSPLLHEQLGLIELERNRPNAAELAFRHALTLAPERATLSANLAEALGDQGRWTEAVAQLDRAIAALDAPGQARLNRAYALFELGRWSEGWAEFEHRFDRPAMAAAPRRPEHFTLARWRGEPIPGPLFVWSEQGLGDEILMGALLPALATRVPRIVFECSPRLAPLFARSFPAIRVLPRNDGPANPPRECIAQIPAGSLFRLLGWTHAGAAPAGFLHAGSERMAAARARHRRPGRRLIGLSWSSRNARLGPLKTLPLELLAQLLAVPDTDYIDLQYGDTDAARRALAAASGVEIRRDPEIDVEQDIDGLAALLACCDAVVSASNVTAHLAGALGLETHVLVPHGRARIWYWLGHGQTSPFYPGARIHRQAADGSWTPALVALRAALTRPTR